MLHFLLVHTFGLFSNTMTDINVIIFSIVSFFIFMPLCFLGDIGFILYLFVFFATIFYSIDNYSAINSYSEKPEIAYNYLNQKSSHYGNELHLTSIDDNIKDFNFNPDNKTIYEFNIIKQKWGNIMAELKYYEKNGDKINNKKTLLLLNEDDAKKINSIIETDNDNNKELIKKEQNFEQKEILRDLIQ
jgi:hypothetical protein